MMQALVTNYYETAAMILFSIGSVSYTHLDVYKRQPFSPEIS